MLSQCKMISNLKVYFFTTIFLETLAILKLATNSNKNIRSYEKVLKQNPDSIEAHFNLAETYIKNKDWDKVKDICKKGLDLKVEDPYLEAKLHECLGAYYMAKGNSEEALNEFKIGLELNPKDNIIRGNLIYCYIERGDIERGIILAGDMIKDYPEHPVGYFRLAHGLFKEGRYKEAIEILEKITNHPTADKLAIQKIYRIQNDFKQ